MRWPERFFFSLNHLPGRLQCVHDADLRRVAFFKPFSVTRYTSNGHNAQKRNNISTIKKINTGEANKSNKRMSNSTQAAAVELKYIA